MLSNHAETTGADLSMRKKQNPDDVAFAMDRFGASMP
jgi:hypothetical protein